MKRAPLLRFGLAQGRPLGWWLASVLDGQRVVRAMPLSGGYRNDNLMLHTDGDQQYVLRRYRNRGACVVEAALAARLAGVVPIADLVAADPDGAVAGEPVLLSRFVPGEMVSAVLPGLAAERARQLGAEVGASLAALGTVTLPGPGFFTGTDLVPEPPDGSSLPAFVADCLARRHPDHALSDAECAGLSRLAQGADRLLDSVAGSHQLVHADFNPKNLLVRQTPAGWTVAAVLDWEFAFSGSPLFDVGNMLRFADDYPPGYVDGFLAGFVDAGGHLPPDWREVSRALDLYALAEFVTAPANDVGRKVLALLRRRLDSPAN